MEDTLSTFDPPKVTMRSAATGGIQFEVQQIDTSTLVVVELDIHGSKTNQKVNDCTTL